MSRVMITDGRDSKTVAIDASNRLQTKSTSISSINSATDSERAFRVVTGDIVLTGEDESGIIYIQNNEDSALIIENVTFGLGISTGGSGSPKLTSYVQPTGGTLITTASDASVVNLSIGSPVTLDANVYKGAYGATIIGTGFEVTLAGTPPYYETQLPRFILKKGFSIAASITPPAGNTSMTVNAFFSAYLNDFV